MTFVRPADSATSTKCEKGAKSAGVGSRARALVLHRADARTPGTDCKRRRRDHPQEYLDYACIGSVNPPFCGQSRRLWFAARSITYLLSVFRKRQAGAARPLWSGMSGGESLSKPPRLGVVRINLERAAQGLPGVLPLGLAGQSGRQIDPCDDIGRRSADRDAEVALCLCQVAISIGKVAHLVLRFGKVGVQLNGPLESRFFAGEILHLVQRSG